MKNFLQLLRLIRNAQHGADQIRDRDASHLWIEALETRWILSSTAAPTIGTFSVSPTSAAIHTPLTLTAANVTAQGGTISYVEFFLESNGVAGFQGYDGHSDPSLFDSFKGQGTPSGSTWTLSNVPTIGLAPGTYTWYGIAGNVQGVMSPIAVATGTLTPEPTVTTAGSTVIANYGQATPITVSATVTSADQIVNEGTVTFAIKQGTSTLATAKSGGLSSGKATATFTVSSLQAGSYQVTATYNPATVKPTFLTSAAASPQTLTVTATLTQPLVVTQPVSQTAVAGGNVTFTAAASGNPVPTAQWQQSSNGTTWTNIAGATSTSLKVAATTAVSGHKYRAVFTNSRGTATTSAASLTVTAAVAPTVTTQPASKTAAAGAAATFMVVGKGTPAPVVQWQSSVNGGSTWSNIVGATSGSYAVTAAIGLNGYKYRAVLSNIAGTATSSSATLTVTAPPVITAQPVNATVASGAIATFSAAVTGNPSPTAQWQQSVNGGTTWTNIAGATSTSLKVTATTALNGYKYRVLFVNSLGSATSSAVALAVQTAPIVTTQPASQTAAVGAGVTFTVAGTGTPAPTVQWQQSVNGGTTWTNIAGATSAAYTFVVTTAANGNRYRAVLTNAAGTATSSAATLTVMTVQTPPTIIIQPANVSANVGGTATFTAAATGTPTPSVQWQVSTDSGSTWVSIAGATSGSYTVTATPLVNGQEYRAVFTNSAGTATTSAATLTVGSAPTVTTQPTSVTADAGGTATFTAVATGNPTPTVQWQVSADGGTNWANVAGAISGSYVVRAATAANGYEYRAVFTNSVGTTATLAAILTVTQPAALPSFRAGVNETVAENASPQHFAGWATNIRPGYPNQASPSLSFQVSTDNTSLFSSQPALDSSGSLSFTPASGASGTATVTVSLANNSNPAGSNTSSALTFTVTVNGGDQTLQTILADYDLVRNTVAFQPYYGEMKGPKATGQTQAGNAWDQAAYLQQLLQSSGITAQLVTGQIQIDGASAAQWLGTSASDGSITSAAVLAAGNILSQSELLVSYSPDSVNPANSRFVIKHAWVQVATGTSAGTLTLDPSWKYTRPQPGISTVLTNVPYIFTNYTSSTAPSQELAYEYYEDQVAAYLQANSPGKTLADVPHTGPIIAATSQSPPSYPYTVLTANAVSTSFSDDDQHQVAITIKDGSGKTLIPKYAFKVPDVSLGTVKVTYGTAGSISILGLAVNGQFIQTVQVVTGSQVQIVVDAYDPGTSANRKYTFQRLAGQDAVLALDAKQTSPTYLNSLQSGILASEQLYVTTPSSAPGLVDSILQYAGMRYWDEYNTQTGIIDGLTSAVEANDQVGVGLVTNYIGTKDPVLDKKADALYVNTPHNVLIDLPGITAAPIPLDGSNTFDGVTNRSRFDLITTNASSLENQIIEEVTNAPSISTVKGLYLASKSGNVVQTIAAGTPSATVKQDLSTYPSAIELQIAADVADGYTVTLPTKLVTEGRWSGAVYYEEKFTSDSASIGFIINDGVTPTRGGAEDNLPVQPSYPLSSAPTIFREQTGGDPIGLASGNVLHDETDVSLPDYGQSLTFSRQYDSFAAISGSTGTSAYMGLGWFINWDESIQKNTNSAVWTTNDGHVYTFTLGKSGYVTPAQLNGTLTLSGTVYTYTEPDGTVKKFQPIRSGSAVYHLTEVRDRNNNAFEITFNSAFELVSVYDAQNPAYALTFSYDATKHLTQVLDPTGRAWNYSYTKLSDGNYYLTQVMSPADASTPRLVTNYAYFDKTNDPSLLLLGLLKSVTRTDTTNTTLAPQTTTFSYYPNRRGFQVTDPDGNTTAVNYKLFRNTAEFVDERGDVTTTTYSSATGLTLKQVNPDQTRDLYTYTLVHFLLASHTDPLGDQTTYAYDYGAADTGTGVGNLLQSVDTATGATTNYTYESAAKFYQVATVAVVSGATTELTQYGHDTHGNTTSVTDAAGGLTTLAYGSRGEVLSRTAPNGNVAQPTGNYTTNLTYNAVGQVLTTTLPGLLDMTGQPATTTDTYDAHYALASATDPTGVVTTYTNDLLGRHLSQTLPDPDGSGPLGPLVTAVRYDAFGNPLSITDPRGLVTQQVFDAKDEPVTVINPNGTKTTNGYDPSGHLTQTTDPLGNLTLSVFDLMGRRSEVVNPDGTTRFIQYAANGAVALAIDENGYATAAAYDAAGRLTVATDTNGNVTRNTYDGFNNLLETAFYPAGLSGAVYSATSSQYDLFNRVVESQGPQGAFQTTAYDSDGNVVRQVRYDVTGYTYDSTGVAPGLSVALSSLPASRQQVTTTAYDVADRPVQVSEPVLAGSSSPLTTATAYDTAGRVLSTTDERGLKTAYGYDAAGRQVSVTAPNPTNAAQLGLTTTSTLDADGNTLVTTDPGGTVITDTYDLKSNRPIVMTTGTVSTYTTFDGDNNVVATTDGEGNRTVDAYDSRNRLVSESQPAPGGMVLNFYDPASRLIKTVDANGRRTDYGYDHLGRKTSETWYATDAGGTPLNQITWTYNAADQLAGVSDKSGTTSYTYDTLNRVVTETNANTGQPVVTYSYNYDGFGNVAKRDTTVGGVTVQTITYQHDADNRLIQETAVTPGNFSTQATATTQQVNYTLNADGQPTTVTRYQSTAGGPLILVVSTTLAYDNDGRVTGITHQQGTTTLDGFQYAYNNASQITGVVSALDGTTAFTYDTAGQIATATYSANADFNENYSFDGAGNNAAFTTAGDNRLTSDGTFSYTYDAAGNMLTRTRLASAAAGDYLTLYAWDNRNRLSEVVSKNNQGTVTQDVTYAYDVQNRRIAETVNGISTFFSYADGNNPALTLTAAGVATAVLYGPDNLQVSEVDAANAVRWMLTDAQGSVRDVVTLSGAAAQVADHLAYNSFGKVLTDTNPATPHLFGYAGQQPDAAVGLNYDQARYYNPQTGRFVSQDPTGLAAGDANLYRYVFNDPVDFVDPSGLHIQLPSYSADNSSYNGTLDLSTLQDSGYGSAESSTQQSGFSRAFANSLNAGQTEAETAADTLVNGNLNWYQRAAVYSDLVVSSLWTPSTYQYTLFAAGAVGGLAAAPLFFGAAAEGGSLAGIFNSAASETGFYGTTSVGSVFINTEEELGSAVISRSAYPESAQHILDAQEAGYPSVLTIDRAGAALNRSGALQGIERIPGMQLDEYPPAMFREGGAGASVRPISPSDNMGSGASLGNQLRSLPNGTKIRITVGK